MTEFMSNNVSVGYAICGSFCTFSKVLIQLEELIQKGYAVTPIMSENAFSTDTRFGKADEIKTKIENICGNSIINDIVKAEPIGPKKMFDILVVAPCSGNTLAKLANSIVDNTITLSVKSHLRNDRPVLLAVSTNDALAGAAKNIGMLLNYKNYYFVPMGQDAYESKPKSVVADFSQIEPAIKAALIGKQIQPMLISPKQ